MERKLSKQDQQTAVDDTTPSHCAPLKPTNSSDVGMLSGEKYQLGSREVTGQDWLLRGENYSALVSLCQGIVDVAPMRSGHVRHMHVKACSKVKY